MGVWQSLSKTVNLPGFVFGAMMVYFIQDSESGAVKIGISENPVRRLADLQTAHHAKLLLIGIMDGERSREQGLHRKFQQKHGEWFAPTDELMAFIAENAMSASSISVPTRTVVSYQPAITVPRPSYHPTPAERIDQIGMTVLYVFLWLALIALFLLALLMAYQWYSGNGLYGMRLDERPKWWHFLAAIFDLFFVWSFINVVRRWFRNHR